MSFRQAKRHLLAALRQGTFEHEVREVLSEKNLPEGTAVFISVHR